MENCECGIYDKLDIRTHVSTVYLENLKPLGENLKSIFYWRDVDSIQIWTIIEDWKSDLDLETVIDAQIAAQSRFPLRSFRFHVLSEESSIFEQLLKIIPDDAALIYVRDRPEKDRITP